MTFTDVAEEIDRLRSAKERVLRALQLSPGGLTNHYAIDVVREQGSTWRVTLRTANVARLIQPPLLPRRTRTRRTAQARLF